MKGSAKLVVSMKGSAAPMPFALVCVVVIQFRVHEGSALHP
jgi:hypothetical protein